MLLLGGVILDPVWDDNPLFPDWVKQIDVQTNYKVAWNVVLVGCKPVRHGLYIHT